ncbi:MAG: hypothetical protein WKG01_00245 [Kofleriaceae bacterium]
MISNLAVVMRWEADNRRVVEVSIIDPDIPCTDVEEGYLGESAVKCQSTPWRFEVDGISGRPTPVTCWSAYDGLFGHVSKRCEGGKGSVSLAESDREEVTIVATTDIDETVIVVPGVRRAYAFVQESGFDRGGPGVVRVDELMLQQEVFPALYSQPDGSIEHDEAFPGEANRLQLSPYALANGTYDVRVLATARSAPNVTIAVPVEGTLTVGP